MSFEPWGLSMRIIPYKGFPRESRAGRGVLIDLGKAFNPVFAGLVIKHPLLEG
jgi:hypothetical protein